MTDHALAIAAMRFGDGDGVDTVLEAVIRSVRVRGHAVAGYLQRETSDGPGCCAIMHLEDIERGTLTRISQALGPGSRGCRLDPRALAAVSGQLLATLGPGTDLVVLNRFGKGEADGQGFRSVIGAACDLGIPVLTAVRETYEPAWSAFTGGMGLFLLPDTKAATQWALAAIAKRRELHDAA